jgi:hypothetical protein
VDVNPLMLENFSRYSDYYLPTPKVIITIAGRSKLADIRAILNIGAEVSVISLDIVVRFEILITYNIGIALRIIIRTKSKFVGFSDNVPITIRNTIIKPRLYIINSPGIKVILRFIFIKS